MAESFNVKILRFDPSVDQESYYKTYEVPYRDPDMGPMSALKALRYINEEVEPVGYDYNCRVGGCGRCTIMVDGVPKLACWAPLSGDHTLEPLPGFPVVKDLVVEGGIARARFVQTDSSVKTLGPITKMVDIDGELWWGVINALGRCKECLACYATCTALQVNHKWDSFIGPGAMMQIYLRHVDTEDKADRVSQAAFSGVFECVQCGKCGTVCPAHIPIAEYNKKLQDEATARGLRPEDTTAVNWPLA